MSVSLNRTLCQEIVQAELFHGTVIGMNEKIRRTVKAKMEAEGLSQVKLAQRLDMQRPNLVRLLNGPEHGIPRRWQEVLDELKLELIAVPKDDDQGEPD